MEGDNKKKRNFEVCTKAINKQYQQNNS